MRDKTAPEQGGKQLNVSLRQGGLMTVLVRELPISGLQQLNHLMENESERVCLYCGKDEGWPDQLTLDSVDKILEVGDELNFSRLQRVRTRRSRVALKTLEFLKTMGELSGTLLAKSPSSPGEISNGSETDTHTEA